MPIFNVTKKLEKPVKKKIKFIIKEKIDIERAKKLIKIPQKSLEYLLDEDTIEDGSGKKYNKHDYVKSVVNLCRNHITKGSTDVEYKYSKNLTNLGRLFSQGFTLQNLKGVFKGYLTATKYHDLDMANAHPTILYYLMKTYYPNQKFDNLKLLLIDREKMLLKADKDRKIAKKKIIKMMNNDKGCDINDEHIQGLDKDFKKAQNLLYSEDCDFTNDLQCFKGLKTYNKKGSFINIVMCKLENEILQETCNSFDDQFVSSLMFDGFHLSKDIEKTSEEIIKQCNDITKDKYGITWTIKEPDEIIENLEVLIVDDKADKDDIPYYDEMKEEFEKTHFMIEHPLMFGREEIYEGQKKYRVWGKTEFQNLTECLKIMHPYEAMGVTIYKKCNFFPKWLADKSHRSYKQIDFSPKIDDNHEFYNTFGGFNCSQPYDYKHNDECVKIFTDHLDFLTGYDKAGTKYFINYIADMFQNPTAPQGVAILLKSPQGYGKDMLQDIIGEMIGLKYMVKSEDIKNVLGTFNSLIKDKIFCVINELDGKDGWGYREQLKGLITSQHININEKGIKQYTQKNSLRIMVNSNRPNPIEISQDDRRFVVFKSSWEKPSKEYFSKLASILEDKDALYTLYNYLMNFKINVSIRNERPITAAYQSMRESNVNPVFNFMNDIFNGDSMDMYFDKGEDYRVNKKTKNIIIKSKSFYENFQLFLCENKLDHIKPTFKGIKIDKCATQCYVFETELIKKKLDYMKIPELVEELDDDWE